MVFTFRNVSYDFLFQFSAQKLVFLKNKFVYIPHCGTQSFFPCALYILSPIFLHMLQAVDCHAAPEEAAMELAACSSSCAALSCTQNHQVCMFKSKALLLKLEWENRELVQLYIGTVAANNKIEARYSEQH